MFGFGKKKLPQKLLAAAAAGDVETIARLLDQGVDIETRAADDNGFTVLATAVFNGRIEAVRLLLERGAKIEERATGYYNMTPLSVAAIKGRLNILQLLLDRGADIKSPDKDGDTALINATRSKTTGVVAELLQRGADKSVRNHAGKSVVDIALADGRKEVYHLLGIKPQIDLPPAPAAVEKEAPVRAENADEVVFFRPHGNRILEETFNFAARERITLLRNGMDGPVEAMTRDSFDLLGDKAALRHAFEIYQSRGGKLAEAEIFPDALGKKSLPGRQP